jgi:hypothetical protein
LKALREWPTPKDKNEIRRFLGLRTYYWRCISGFGNIVKQMTRLTEEKQAFQRTSEVEATFQTLQGALCAAPFLAYSQPEETFIVNADASNFGIGGILSQIKDGQERVIAYYSKTLNIAERNYGVTRRELLATVRHWNISISTCTDKSSTCTWTTRHQHGS